MAICCALGPLVSISSSRISVELLPRVPRCEAVEPQQRWQLKVTSTTRLRWVLFWPLCWPFITGFLAALRQLQLPQVEEGFLELTPKLAKICLPDSGATEFLDRIGALGLSLPKHQHRCFGVPELNARWQVLLAVRVGRLLKADSTAARQK